MKKGGFEDIEVGEIIMFYDVDGPRRASSSVSSGLSKGELPDDSVAETPAPDSISDAPDATVNTDTSNTQTAGNYLSYDAHGNDVSKDQLQIDTSRTITHRVVQVGVDISGQKLVYTEGDGNGYKDQYATSSDNYIGKVVWYKNGIGGILSAWFHIGFLIILVAAGILAAVLILQRINHKE